MNNGPMTLAEFRATRTVCLDIGAAIEADMDDEHGRKAEGFLYCDSGYILKDGDEYVLWIFREEFIAKNEWELSALELRLFEFLLSESSLHHPPELAARVALWRTRIGEPKPSDEDAAGRHYLVEYSDKSGWEFNGWGPYGVPDLDWLDATAIVWIFTAAGCPLLIESLEPCPED